MAEKKDTLKEALDACFKGNKNIEVLHQTADGQCFVKESDAKAHSQTLKDKTVKKHERA